MKSSLLHRKRGSDSITLSSYFVAPTARGTLHSFFLMFAQHEVTGQSFQLSLFYFFVVCVNDYYLVLQNCSVIFVFFFFLTSSNGIEGAIFFLPVNKKRRRISFLYASVSDCSLESCLLQILLIFLSLLNKMTYCNFKH